MPALLLGTGALCLLVAAVIFLAVAWSWLGVGGRTAVLVTLTGLGLAAGAVAAPPPPGGGRGVARDRGARAGDPRRAGCRRTPAGSATPAPRPWCRWWASRWPAPRRGSSRSSGGSSRRSRPGCSAWCCCSVGCRTSPGPRSRPAWPASSGSARSRCSDGGAVCPSSRARRAPPPAGWWVVTAALAAQELAELGRPTFAGVWVDGPGWALAACAVLLGAVALVPRLDRAAADLVLAAAGSLLTGLVALPVADEGATAVGVVSLAAGVVWLGALALLARTRPAVALVPAVLSLVPAVLLLVALLGQAAVRTLAAGSDLRLDGGAPLAHPALVAGDPAGAPRLPSARSSATAACCPRPPWCWPSAPSPPRRSRRCRCGS